MESEAPCASPAEDGFRSAAVIGAVAVAKLSHRSRSPGEIPLAACVGMFALTARRGLVWRNIRRDRHATGRRVPRTCSSAWVLLPVLVRLRSCSGAAGHARRRIAGFVVIGAGTSRTLALVSTAGRLAHSGTRRPYGEPAATRMPRTRF